MIAKGILSICVSIADVLSCTSLKIKRKASKIPQSRNEIASVLFTFFHSSKKGLILTQTGSCLIPPTTSKYHNHSRRLIHAAREAQFHPDYRYGV